MHYDDHCTVVAGSSVYETVKAAITTIYANYFAFFNAVKVAVETSQTKIWLTGVTPIGIKKMSGLNVARVSFHKDLADAVGLTEDDINKMLIEVNPFKTENMTKQKHWSGLISCIITFTFLTEVLCITQGLSME